MTILASFTTKIDERPGSVCTEITFMLRRRPVFFGLFHKFSIERLFYDYTNTFDMSNGEPGIVGKIHDVLFVFWSGSQAFDVFSDLQYTHKVAIKREL